MRKLSLSLAQIVLAGITILFTFGSAQPVQAQEEQRPKRGFHSANSYALGDIETISTTSGNLMLHLPLASLPAGRGGLTHGLQLNYNSKLLDQYTAVGTDPYTQNPVDQTLLSFSSEGGWMYSFGYSLQVTDRYLTYDSTLLPQCPNAEARYRYKVKLRFPDGSLHEFRPEGRFNYQQQDWFDIRPDGFVEDCGSGTWVTSTLNYYSVDGTYMRLEVQHDSDQYVWNNPWTLYLPDGGKITGGNAPNRMYDRNGNYVELQYIADYNQTGHPATLLVDQLGRSVAIEYNYAASEDYVRVPGVNNQPLTWTVKWNSVWFYKKYGATAGNPYPDDLSPYVEEIWNWLPVVESVTLPAQAGTLSYNFGYNSNATWPNQSYGWGEVSSVTLPEGVRSSGATASYQYACNGYTSTGYHLYSLDVLQNTPTQKDLTYWLEYDGTATQTTETWTYAIYPQSGSSTIVGPDGGVITEYFGQTNLHYWNAGLVYKTVQTDGSVIERLWQQNVPYGMSPSPGYGNNSGVNTYVKTEFRSLKDAGGTLTKTAIKDYTYDKNGNVTQVAEYDWVAYSSVPRDINGNPTGVPSGVTPKRVVVNTYYSPTPDASNSTTDDADVYHKTTSPQLKRAIESGEVRSDFATSAVLSRTESFYDNATTTGNLIQQKSWDSTKGGISRPLGQSSTNFISVSHTYDGYGNRTQTTDANSNVSKFTYGSINGYTNLYPTQTIVGENLSNNSTIKRTTNLEYDFWRGLVTLAIDADNNIATENTYDVFGRPTLVEEGGTGTYPNFTYLRQTSTEYEDTQRRVIVRASKDTKTDGLLISVQHYDQLGRVRLTRKLESGVANDATDETKGVKVQTRYFRGNGSNPNSYTLVSNPYRTDYSYNAGSEYTMGWTHTKSDQGGRNIEVQTFGGATLPAPWGSNSNSTGAVLTAYDGERVLVTDQAGKKRLSETDGLGRLSTVWEITAADAATEGVTFPNQSFTAGYKTTYGYDTLNNLLTVTQREGTSGTLQTRTFAYSSLQRLTSATNPESGTTNYQYDNNGNLTYKVDALNRSTWYGYDALNRSLGYYTNDPNTPQVILVYDGATNGKGRLWYNMTNSYYVGGSGGQYLDHIAVDSYDALGRPLVQRQHFRINNDTAWSSAYQVSRTYDLAGNMKSQTYPSNKVVNYSYNNAAQLSSFTGNLGDGVSRNYATDITYTPAGQMAQENFGVNTSMDVPNGLWHNMHYNNRQQLYDIRLGTGINDGQGQEWTWNRGAIRLFYGSNWAYGNGGVENNGNITRMDHFVPTNEAVSTYAMSLDYYQYDALNRITGVWENKQAHNLGETSTGLTQQYTYDRFGNRMVNNAVSNFPGVFNQPFTVDKTTNRLLAPNATISYDAVGNQTNDNYTGAGNRTYDANNKLVSAAASSGTASYRYDANGSRVIKTANSVTTWNIYGMGGELVAEYAANGTIAQKEYGYRGGQMLVVYDSTETGDKQLQWLVQDHLGSTRMVVDLSGSLTGMKRHDYLPFGEEIGANVGIRDSAHGYPPPDDKIRQKFTGYEKDAETGLDYAQARMYANVQGRFTSVDPILSSGRPFNPMTWNRYLYVLNNPLKLSDPSGLFEWDSTLKDSEDLDKEERKRRAKLREAFTKGISKAREAAAKGLEDGKITQEQANKINSALDAYGAENFSNGVTVGIGTNDGAPGSVDAIFPIGDDWKTIGAEVSVKFDENFLKSGDGFIAVLHEGAHVEDALMYKNTYNKVGAEKSRDFDLTNFATEQNAFRVQSYLAQARGKNDQWGVWDNKWAKLDAQQMQSTRQSAIVNAVNSRYGLTEDNPGISYTMRQCKPCKK